MSKNAFISAVMSNTFFTENGAISHATTGSALLDYFSKCGTYRDRKQAEVNPDMDKIWAESPQLALMIIFYMRLITRRTSGFFSSETVQKGQGARDEFRKALRWLAQRHPEVLKKNLWLVPEAGRWSDLWHEDVIDMMPREAVYGLVRRGMEDDFHGDLVAKYLPRIRSASQTHTERHRKLNDWARGFVKWLGWSARDYRRFKSNPERSAHAFQRKMCAGLWDEIDFSRIPGRALFQLVSHRGREDKLTMIERHGQSDRFMQWMKTQPTAKFSGYAYELYQAARKGNITPLQKLTYDRQFEGLVAKAKEDRGGITENVWCALDTSGSMGAQVTKGTSALDVCLGLGLYFSALNEGAFKDHVVMFDSTSRMLQLKGNFTDRVKKLSRTTTAWGSTNFQSVIDLICQVRRQKPHVPIEDFPSTLLVVSDMQFNPVGGNTQTNYQAAVKKLAQVGLPPIKIVWWWVTGRGRDFPSTIGDEGVTLIGGFDGAILELLLGQAKPTRPEDIGKMPTPYEQMVTALDQELLRQLKVG